jgi:outer membrane immunogenic protein
MNKIISSIAAAIAFMATCIVAQAADLPMAPAYQPAPVVVPVYNWTGIYIGVNGGWGGGQQEPFNIFTDRFDAFNAPLSGWMFGGTAGAQIQSGHVVLGFEADIDWANITGSATVVPTIGGVPIAAGTASLTSNITSVSTGRMRVGYALDNWMLYATAGLALLGSNANVSTLGGVACNIAVLGAVCSGTDYRLGGTAGAGIEWGFTPSMSAKVEYLYITAASFELSHINVVRAGLNFRFGGL